MTTTRYAVPAVVQRSQTARDRARQQPRQCAGDAGRCGHPARHSCPSVGGAWCDQCWASLGIHQPTVDPARTLDGLRSDDGGGRP
jgi:hypothetical protein